MTPRRALLYGTLTVGTLDILDAFIVMSQVVFPLYARAARSPETATARRFVAP